MTIQAYTYLIVHKPSGMAYYGSRKSCTPEKDLFVEYFTSSKIVNELINRDGRDSFSYEVRRTFYNYELAKRWELKVLRKMRVTHNEKFFNKVIAAPPIYIEGSKTENERRRKIGDAMRKRWLNPEFRYKQEHLTEEQRKIRSENGKKLLGRSYRKTKKPEPKKVLNAGDYTVIVIEKNGKINIIHRNQLPAYNKCGWRKYE